MAPRETENNTNVKFWGDKQRALWYVMVFLEWSIVLLMIPLIVYKPFNLIQDEVFEFEKEEVGEGKGDKVRRLSIFECSLQNFLCYISNVFSVLA